MPWKEAKDSSSCFSVWKSALWTLALCMMTRQPGRSLTTLIPPPSPPDENLLIWELSHEGCAGDVPPPDQRQPLTPPSPPFPMTLFHFSSCFYFVNCSLTVLVTSKRSLRSLLSVVPNLHPNFHTDTVPS